MDGGDISSDSSEILVSLFQPTSDSQAPLKPDSFDAASSSSSDTQHLSDIRHAAEMYARATMSASSAAEATRTMCSSLPSVQWSDELSVATLAGMRAVAELLAVDYFVTDARATETDSRMLARIRCRVQHILTLPA